MDIDVNWLYQWNEFFANEPSNSIFFFPVTIWGLLTLKSLFDTKSFFFKCVTKDKICHPVTLSRTDFFIPLFSEVCAD